MKNHIHQKYLLSATVLLPAVIAAQQAVTAEQRPNIMIIMVDDMGYSDMGCYGGEIQTPHLDSLANTGIRFTQFFNGSRSCPSRASLLTGCYPHTVGITGMGLSLANNCVTIAEVLQTAGYKTAMTGKWHLSLTEGIGNNADQMAWLSNQNTFNNRPFAPVQSYPCNRGSMSTMVPSGELPIFLIHSVWYITKHGSIPTLFRKIFISPITLLTRPWI